ncbi:diguanylate cyclase [Roseibium aggregatum]|uniref:diguanylate cyclase n=1 Tax=Roseibium aggregatum TaxID=187304 RepID=A0A939EBY6_9HYPH|nr:diguanylate cyclase [Roseibium aggregatum]MBN9669769.1 diguanylate cyclase [Roseibium aggregatum]
MDSSGERLSTRRVPTLRIKEQTPPARLAANKTILVADTGEGFVETSQLLGGFGFSVLCPEDCSDPASCTVAFVNPDLDGGLDLCKSLSADCKVFLTTNNRDFEFKIEAVRMGAQGLLSRPLNAVEVFSSLEETRKDELPDARVLIVDDDDLTATVYAMALEECGLRVAVLNNPLHAETAIDEFRPDLLIMDIEMPEANGLDVARAIRLDPAHTSLPILFLSAVMKKGLQQKAREIGGDDFIRKPVDIGYLVKMVRMRAARSVELRQIMVRDGLTGLINHVSFKEKLATEINRSARTKAPFSVALIDLDHFKSINDTYGHQTGDKVLQTFATLLKSSLRNVDIIGRYGGEEFGVILLDANPDQAATTMDRIRREFERVNFTHANKRFHVTFSCGLAGSDDGGNCEMLLALADTALYEAKARGRNRITRFDSSLKRRSGQEQAGISC